MGEEFNKKQMFENISYALTILGKRVGELEKEIGVSTGYIARTSKDANAKPGIDFIVKAADALDMSVDTLLNADLAGLTETERYIVNFLDKLIRDTEKDKLDWVGHARHYYETYEPDINGFVDHPLLSYETFNVPGESGYPDEVTAVVFMSKAFDVLTSINRDCYQIRLKNGTMLYLMDICKSVRYSHDPDAFATEVWICKSDSNRQFLCSTKSNKALATLVENLYSAVAESAKHPKLDKDVKAAIDAFMVDDLKDDDPFDDIGDLPF